MCQVGVCNEGRSSSIAIGLSNDCQRVFNEVSLTLLCHAVVHFEVEISRCLSPIWPLFRTIVLNVEDHLEWRLFLFRANFLCLEQHQDPARS